MPQEESEAVLSSQKSGILESARSYSFFPGKHHLQAEWDRSCWQERQSGTWRDPHKGPAFVSLVGLRVSHAHSRQYPPVWEPA